MANLTTFPSNFPQPSADNRHTRNYGRGYESMSICPRCNEERDVMEFWSTGQRIRPRKWCAKCSVVNREGFYRTCMQCGETKKSNGNFPQHGAVITRERRYTCYTCLPRKTQRRLVRREGVPTMSFDCTEREQIEIDELRETFRMDKHWPREDKYETLAEASHAQIVATRMARKRKPNSLWRIT